MPKKMTDWTDTPPAHEDPIPALYSFGSYEDEEAVHIFLGQYTLCGISPPEEKPKKKTKEKTSKGAYKYAQRQEGMCQTCLRHIGIVTGNIRIK